MLRMVLDTNCVIDLEERRPDSVFLDCVVQAWRTARISLAVVAISASENQRGGMISKTYKQFISKLENAGLTGVTELLPIARLDVTYWDHALLADESMIEQERLIRMALFPTLPEVPSGDEKAKRDWRNKLCDVAVAWSVAHHQWDALVTRDKGFHQNKARLSELGVQAVLYPQEAAELCMQMR